MTGRGRGASALTGLMAAHASSNPLPHRPPPVARWAAACIASSRRSMPLAEGTAMRIMPGIPKFAQSRTTTPAARGVRAARRVD